MRATTAAKLNCLAALCPTPDCEAARPLSLTLTDKAGRSTLAAPMSRFPSSKSDLLGKVLPRAARKKPKHQRFASVIALGALLGHFACLPSAHAELPPGPALAPETGQISNRIDSAVALPESKGPTPEATSKPWRPWLLGAIGLGAATTIAGTALLAFDGTKTDCRVTPAGMTSCANIYDTRDPGAILLAVGVGTLLTTTLVLVW